jgi:hypothetical protein
MRSASAHLFSCVRARRILWCTTRTICCGHFLSCPFTCFKIIKKYGSDGDDGASAFLLCHQAHRHRDIPHSPQRIHPSRCHRSHLVRCRSNRGNGGLAGRGDQGLSISENSSTITSRARSVLRAVRSWPESIPAPIPESTPAPISKGVDHE